ncbi:MAG TPA: hypothetical protein VFJ58_02660 [Armatimonadota bacterium]|nr:hypothetical protein [Armatimonadota bacterium]
MRDSLVFISLFGILQIRRMQMNDPAIDEDYQVRAGTNCVRSRPASGAAEGRKRTHNKRIL